MERWQPLAPTRAYLELLSSAGNQWLAADAQGQFDGARDVITARLTLPGATLKRRRPGWLKDFLT